MHSLVTSRLDYCNSLLYGIPDNRLKLLQRIQNIAARVVAHVPCSPQHHVTPILSSLHWLLIKSRIVFKILLLTYKCVNGLAPKYLCDLISLRTSSRPLRSDSLQLLQLPRIRLVSYGKRSFAYGAVVERNKLPLDIRLSPTIATFKAKLKTYLFQQCYG